MNKIVVGIFAAAIVTGVAAGYAEAQSPTTTAPSPTTTQTVPQGSPNTGHGTMGR